MMLKEISPYYKIVDTNTSCDDAIFVSSTGYAIQSMEAQM